MAPFLVPPNDKTSTPKIARGLAQAQSQTHRGIGNARSVHVQEHFVLVGKAGQITNLLGLVNRPHFGGLSDGNHARLNMVLVADPMVSMAHRLDRQLAVRRMDEDQFATGELFRGAAFVGMNVGHVGANYRVVGLGQRLQAQAIGRGAIEYR